MKEYHKIKGVFRFDEHTHKPIPMIDEYFLPLKNNERIFTEKIDGTNIRVHRDGHKVSFGGRTENAQIPVRLLNRLQELFMEELFEQNFGEIPVTLYGEGYGGKIQHGKRDYKEDEDFILFDVNINDTRLERENVVDISLKLGISVVPVVVKGTMQDGIDYVKDNYKDYQSNEPQKEGLIGVPVGGFLDRLGKRIIVKIKKEHFKE